MAQIKFFPKDRAREMLFTRIHEAGGMKVMLFRAKLMQFLDVLLAKYVMGLCDHEATAALAAHTSDSGQMQVGGVALFAQSYALEVLFAEAQTHGLPVAVIRDDLTNFLKKMYSEQYVLGEPMHPRAITALIGAMSEIQMTLKPKEPA